MTVFSKAVYNTLDKISRSNVSINVYYLLYKLQRMYTIFAKYIGLAVTYVKHENTQELGLMLRGGMAVPGKVLELILTWQYYIFCCPFYFDHQLILSVFIYHDIMMPYDFYYYLSLIRTVIVSFLKRFDCQIL